VSPESIHTNFVALPAGRFRMGGLPEDKFVSAVELPRHEVEVAAFELARHPVTRAQWFGGEVSNPELPVTGISFDEAESFARRYDCRLPSEAEWEYACRAGSATVFSHASDLGVADANFLYDESGVAVGRGAPMPVGSHPPNAFGLHDLLGNVCEWTADLWHPGYSGAPDDGLPWIDGGKPGHRVIRGGAWDHLPRLLRASWRDPAPESARWDNLGFRLARDL
jgi:formylglycine-generating enzyme required for sulfatase activity